MDPRLRAIGTPSIRTEAVELVKLALEALDELKKIDESLYGLFVASRNAPADPEMAAAKLRLIWDGAFRPLSVLIDYCRRIDDEAEVTVTGDGDADLDFGDFEAQEEKSFELDIGDIGELVAGLDGGGGARSESEKWAEVKAQVRAIEYRLNRSSTMPAQRREVALSAGQTGHVLGLLDDTTAA